MEKPEDGSDSAGSVGGSRRTAAPSVSGLEIRVLANELSRLSGSYVSSLHALGGAQLLRLRRSMQESESEGRAGEGDADVVLSSRFGAWLTRRPGYTVTAPFTTALRGVILRKKLSGVRQLGFDRVMIFEFSSKEGAVKLVLELIPPGNIVVTDESGRVLLAQRESRGGARAVVRGRLYTPPAQTRVSPEAMDEGTMDELLRREKTVGRALGRGISLPKKYVDEILERASLSQDSPTSEVSREKSAELAKAVLDLTRETESPNPAIIERNGELELMAVHPSSGDRVVSKSRTMSELMDSTFTPLLLQEAEGEEGRGADREVGSKERELEVTLERLEEQVEDLSERSAELRQLAASAAAATSEEELRSLLENGHAKDGREGLPETPARAASRLYDEAKMKEAEIARIRDARKEMAARLERERARAKVPESRVKVVVREKKEWYEKFRWFFTTEGRLAIGGRDAQSNSMLLKRYVDERDLVYHADLFGSPFFVLKGGSKTQTEAEARQMGQATATYSSAWKTGLAAADAYWVEPEQVSSSAPSGEFLARGSFAIRGKKNFVGRNPVELSVGLDEEGRVLAGPEEALMKRSRAHVTLIPHREKASDTAKKVLFELRRYYPEELKGTSVDDVLRVLPAGGGKIIRRRENRRADAPDPGPESAP